MEDCRMCKGISSSEWLDRSSTFLLPPWGRLHWQIKHIHLGSSTFRDESNDTQALQSSHNTYWHVSACKGIEKGTYQHIAAVSNRKGRSGTPSELQGWLLSILAHCPTTADSAQSCLLCCQPEPVPRTLAARMSQFTLGHPCRLSAWSGWAIHMHPQHM